MTISPTIQTLLDRMDKFPEEFVDVHSSATKYGFDGITDGSRWEGVTDSIVNGGNYEVFTPEEIHAYKSKLAEILRKKLDEDICRELVSHEKNPRQMELPLDQTRLYGDSILKHIEAHRKILGLTPTMRIKDKTS